MPAVRLREAWLEADSRHLARLDSLDAGQRGSVRVPYFAGLLDLASYAGYRLSEQAVHGWDIEVALDPGAEIPAPLVRLLWERIDLVVTRFRSADVLTRLAPGRLRVQLTDTGRSLMLGVGTELHLYPTDAADPTGSLSGTAESVLRLLYGRSRSRDRLTTTGEITPADLRALFPGF
jgi:hypothetical protein